MEKIYKTVLAVVAVAAIAFIVWYTLRQPIAYLGRGISPLEPLVPRNATALYSSALESYYQYRANAGRWSAVYFGCTFGAALFSAAAGVILKLDSLSKRETLRKDLAASLAAAAALLITLSTTGNFEAKWRANRLAASSMESVIYRIAKPDTGRAKILDDMAEIHRRLNESVASGQVVTMRTDSATRGTTQTPATGGTPAPPAAPAAPPPAPPAPVRP